MSLNMSLHLIRSSDLAWRQSAANYLPNRFAALSVNCVNYLVQYNELMQLCGATTSHQFRLSSNYVKISLQSIQVILNIRLSSDDIYNL